MPEEINEKKVKIDKSSRTQLIVFRLGNEDYGLLLDEIKEVVLTPAITPMPQVPNYVKGIANIRGNIISIYDLEEKFGLVDNNGELGRYTLVSESAKFKAGILVKNVPDTLTIDKKNIEEQVGIVQDNAQEGNYIKGIIKLDGRLIILLDLNNAISAKEISGIMNRVKVTRS